MSTMLRTRVDHLEIARHYARNAQLWAVQPEFNAANRWYACLADDDDAQVWLLTWLPGQGTDLHDHGTSAGAFAVARGTLTERVVAARSREAVHQSTTDLAAGRVRYFGEHHVHQVTNALTEPAVSVHVYAPALRWMNTYRVEDGVLVRTGTQRAGVDW
jgi:predicted metal-dependent enzyme (double-stranded beta helix superfamily)